MTDGETIGPTQLVLEPANVTVHVARNLSPWYRDVPDIDVKGKLLAVKVSLLTNSTWKGNKQLYKFKTEWFAFRNLFPPLNNFNLGIHSLTR